ncbi:MAG: hypothetical protein KIS62_02065 [Ramlibacter sp.]|nr:hypothetical protein [Ramlibacter sp.]
MLDEASAPAAFQGPCQRCGAPDGLLRHAPPPSPSSGVWCNRCYRRLQRLRWLVPGGVALAAMLAGWALARLG